MNKTGSLEKAVEELAHSTMVEWADRLFIVGSAIGLGVMLMTTVFGVIARYVFDAPLLGNNEIVQLALVAMVMLAMMPAARNDAHIRVDVLDYVIGSKGRLFGDVLARAISLYVLGRLALRSWTQLLDAAEFGDATNMLAIPIWPFYGLIVFGFLCYALFLALELALCIARRRAMND